MYAKDKSTIIDRREMLRVKLKSLAEEARIIRHEELRSHGALREELYLHRIHEVRFEARAAHLAYGFIRGRTWEEMEPTHDYGQMPGWAIQQRETSLWGRVRALLKKYGPRDFQEPACMQAEQPALALAA